MYKMIFGTVIVAFLSMGLMAIAADDKAGQDQYGMSMADMMKECMEHGGICADHLDQARQAKGEEMGKHLDQAKQHMADCMALMHMMEPSDQGDNMKQCLEHGKQCNIHLYLADRSHKAGKHDEAVKHLDEAKQHMTQCLAMLKMMDKGGAKK